MLAREGFGLEAEGAIREATVAVVVVFVDRAGVDEVLETKLREDVAEFGVEAYLELAPAGGNHTFEHCGVAGLGDGLEFLAQVTVVAIGPDGDASADRRIEILRMTPPLLESVAFEKLLIELPTDLTDNHFLGVGRVVDGNAFFGQPRFHFLRGGGTPEELLEGVEVDRKVPITAVAVGEDFVIDRMPLGELAQVIDDARGIGAEVVRSVSVNEDAGLVVFVVGITAEVVALFDDETGLPLLRGETLGDGQAGKSGADDEAVDGLEHGAGSAELGVRGRRGRL